MADQEIIQPARPSRGPIVIKHLMTAPLLPERGKIKIGGLGEERQKRGSTDTYRLPVKYDHFVITTLARDVKKGDLVRDEAMHERFGEKPTEIPIRLLYDDPVLNFPTRYACYKGRTLWCTGDGETASRQRDDSQERYQVECPCFRADPTYNKSDKCRMNGALNVIIDGASGLGGVWKFRTTSYNSITGLMSSMAFLKTITGGPLAGIPLTLRVQPKQAVNPVDGSAVLVYVVGIEYAGNVHELQAAGHQIALDRETTKLSIIQIEREARHQLALIAPHNAPLPGDDAEEVRAEFYPETYDEPPEDDPPPTRQQFRQQQDPHTRVPTRAEVEDPATKPPEPPVDGREGVEGAGSASETEARLSDAAEHQRSRPATLGQANPAGDTGEWEVTNPEDGEVKSYATAAEAEIALMAILHKSLSRALNAKPGTLLAKSVEAAAESNDALLKTIPDEIYQRLSTRIASAIEQVRLAHDRVRAGKAPSPTPPATEHPHPQQASPPLPADRPQPSNAVTPPSNGDAAGGVVPGDDDDEPPRDIERDIGIKKITYGPNRGVNWGKTIAGAIELIRTLTATELDAFRTYGSNGKTLAEANLVDMNLRQQQGGNTGQAAAYVAQINRAIAERQDALRRS